MKNVNWFAVFSGLLAVAAAALAVAGTVLSLWELIGLAVVLGEVSLVSVALSFRADLPQ